MMMCKRSLPPQRKSESMCILCPWVFYPRYFLFFYAVVYDTICSSMHREKLKSVFVGLIVGMVVCGASAADISALDVSIQNVRAACDGLSNQMGELKRMAGINTAVTGVGTLASGGATVVGIVKSNVDAQAEEIEKWLERFMNQPTDTSDNPKIDLTGIDKDTLMDMISSSEPVMVAVGGGGKSEIAAKQEELNQKTQQSKTLGNVRTGLLATGTVSNIAGAVIAGKNRTQGGLAEMIADCVDAVRALENAKMHAHVAGTVTDDDVALADKIIAACGGYKTVDLSVVDNRAKGATISSGIGAATGLVGTITSGVANSNKTRSGDASREKNLNTASNVLSGTTTAASLTATIFNATQINAVKDLVQVADQCEDALK